MKLLTIYDKLEKLVQRLPETLQGPILREITPVKTLFLLQRPPRLALVGDRSASKAALVNAIFGEEIMSLAEESLHDGVWQTLHSRGALQVLDARRPVAVSVSQTSLAAEAPDLWLFAREKSRSREAGADLQHAAQLVEFTDRRHEVRPHLLGVQMHGDIAARDALHAALYGETAFAMRLAGTFHFNGAPGDAERLIALLAAELPAEARLEMARLSGNRELQQELARVVVKSMTAICGAVGTQPIPLADFPILTSLQASMVAGIMHISGRQMSPKLAGEFIGALGANLGVALVMREGARAALKFLPVWGDFASGAIAAAGTYAVGRAAVAYFIEGVSIRDARAYFRKAKKERPALKG